MSASLRDRQSDALQTLLLHQQTLKKMQNSQILSLSRLHSFIMVLWIARLFVYIYISNAIPAVFSPKL